MISDDDIRRVREATDLVNLVQETVVLRQKGREFWGRCPFHDEKTPSFKVDPRSQLFHCFGCHAGGDSYGFVMRTQNMDFIDAVRYLADRANITLTETKGSVQTGKRQRLQELMKASAEFYALQLLRSTEAGSKAARAYLSGRNMGTELAKRWQMGYAPGGTMLFDHLRGKGFTAEECLDANVAVKGQRGYIQDRFYERVMFPVADLQGRVIAFGGRVIGTREPKYLNTSETLLFHKRETLYALDKAKAAISSQGTAIVVEGYTDTIAMHEAGFTNAVATLGTALTIEHLKLLNRFAKKVIYLFDGDEAGTRAAVRAAELITQDITPEAGRFRVMLEVAELPPGSDPADLLAKQGAEALQAVLDQSTPLVRFAIQHSLKKANLASPEGRHAALRSALQVLLPIRGSILANTYIADELAPQLGVEYSQALALFNGLQAPRAQGQAEQVKDQSEQAKDQSSPSNTNLQNELLVLYIEYPETRELLAEAFERVTWDGEDLPKLAKALTAADKTAESSELYARALDAAPAYAPVLSTGLRQTLSGSARDHAFLLMYMLRESQLLNEIALAKIAYAKALDGNAGNTLFREIAEKQSELAVIREKLAKVPKTFL
ncbi:MAG: DNA primase [Coriobacteriia bacterium]|nr:DNA primase [Coriobacteriia bacterium]MCL2750807.1 DNA primase [Coriobacteriia bacterium]